MPNWALYLEAVADVFPKESVLRETPDVDVTAAEVDRVGMDALKFWNIRV